MGHSMNEVSCQTVALVADAVVHRGLDPFELWAGLPLDAASLRDRHARIDWEVWVELMERTERGCGGPHETERLFVSGAGARTGHGFVRIANAFLSVQDLYVLFARWGIRGTLRCVDATMTLGAGRRAQFSASIAEDRAGSAPTLRFIAGLLRKLPVLQGLAETVVTVEPGLHAHGATYTLVLPEQQTLRSRLRRVLSVARGASATLEALEDQSTEIINKNAELQLRLAELERTTAALKEREAWLELALDTAKVGIWQWDLHQGGAMRWSAGTPRLLGLREGEAVTAAAWTEALHPDDRARAAKAFEQAAKLGQPYEIEARVPTESGVRWIRTRGHIVTDAQGKPVHASGTVMDFTEQRALEARLRHADRILAAGTLAAGVAHEINNPLTFVLSNLDLLREEARAVPMLAARFGEMLGEMTDGLHRIRNVVRDLRTFSRPEEDRIEAVDLQAVCEAAIRLVSPSVRHRAELRTEFYGEPLRARANDARLGQVVVNLIVNAMQSMPPRPVSEAWIVVRTARSGPQVVLEVEDNGTGIAPAALPRIFEPFFSTKGPSANHGLGLSVCQTIIEGFGGHIEVDTALGRGTTFRVLLPTAAERTASSAPPPSTNKARARVLVIDDEPLVRKTLSRLLTGRGHEVVEVGSAHEALSRVAAHEFDVLLCDLMMPEMTGFDLHATLEQTRPDVARRMVFISGGAVTEQARAFVEHPGRRVLEKPFDMAAVLEAVDAVAQS
ncbi:MAG: response regulator [Myxococcales bacterium]|nr:response regulator [Myxococcales bacterium]